MAKEHPIPDQLIGGVEAPQEMRYANFADLVFSQLHNEDDTQPILVGCVELPELRTVRVSLRQLRHSILTISANLTQHGIKPSDTVALIRLPHTSELLTAIVYSALTALGVRVLFPMILELDGLEQWLRASKTCAVLMSPEEALADDPAGVDVNLVENVTTAAQRCGAPVFRFCDDLGVLNLLEEQPSASPTVEDARVKRLVQAASSESECLLLTTSGTSGQAKIVRYSHAAFLRSCASWELAGLFEPDLLGGRGLSLLLGHSMGLRGLWNAIWTRKALCFVTPEWFVQHPERVCGLLQEMMPEHVTGGPATFHTLLEFARLFPGLKEQCFQALKCLVSSGAPFDTALSTQITSSFGLTLHNAFGMTETMQVSSTLAPGPEDCSAGFLGNPLPGVRFRLEPVTGFSPETYRLFIRTPFGFRGYLDDNDQTEHSDKWFFSGDVVQRTEHGLRHVGREAVDFVNDSLGVKLSRARLARLYEGAEGFANWIGFFPLGREPGLAALVFASDATPADALRSGKGDKPEGQSGSRKSGITDSALLHRVQSFFESRLEVLRTEVEEFEFRHLSVGRFAIVYGQPERTEKGTVKYRDVEEQWADLIKRMTGRYTKHSDVVYVDRERFARAPSVRLVRPRLGELIRLLKLDRHFVRGHGDRLIYKDKDGEHEVVDFVGGYGGNLLGHRHPKIMETVRNFVEGEEVFMFDQGSAQPRQGELARQLATQVGASTGASYIVRFGSTGSEAVEMALAHASLQRDEAIRHLIRDQKRRFGSRFPDKIRTIEGEIRDRISTVPPVVLALQRSFHGHSLGARSVLGHPKKRRFIETLSNIKTLFLDPNDRGQLQSLTQQNCIELPVLEEKNGQVNETQLDFSNIIAAIVEPVQGEGGVRVVDRSFLKELAGFSFPLIIDEIQAGLGRTGHFLASEGVVGDIYLFSKALGGGVAKISAVLIERRRYVPRFDELYASTFAGDAFSSRVACRVVELLVEEDIPARCQERGDVLRQALDRVCKAFPNVVTHVRGAGLMLAVTLNPQSVSNSMVLRALAREEHLGALAAGYLFNEHQIRVLPTLSAPNTLRVEPSAFIDDEAIAQLSDGLWAFCDAITNNDLAHLLSFLVREENALSLAKDPPPLPKFSSAIEKPAKNATRVAFISHFVYPERELAMADPQLLELSSVARRSLANQLTSLMQLKPMTAFARNVLGNKVWFCNILVPTDVAMLETLHRMHYRFVETERLQQAVDMAASMGCKFVALGGYTSIMSADGTAILPPKNVRITSGNTFTAVVGVRRIIEACQRAGIDPQDPNSCVAVVGATGNIGSSIVMRLLSGPRAFRRALMIGRNMDRLFQFRSRLEANVEHFEIDVSTDLEQIRDSNVIAIATNTNEPLIYPHHLSNDRDVVIADVSVPSAVSRHVRRLSNVTVIPLAGAVAVPGQPDFVISSHTKPGTAFCCAAEAMILGLEPKKTRSLCLTGRVDQWAMAVLERFGEQYGFLDTMSEGGFKLG